MVFDVFDHEIRAELRVFEGEDKVATLRAGPITCDAATAGGFPSMASKWIAFKGNSELKIWMMTGATLMDWKPLETLKNHQTRSKSQKKWRDKLKSSLVDSDSFPDKSSISAHQSSIFFRGDST